MIAFQYNKTSLQHLEKQLKMRVRTLPIIKNKESALRIEVKKCKDAMKEHGLYFDRSYWQHGDFWKRSARKMADEIADGILAKPEAILCGISGIKGFGKRSCNTSARKASAEIMPGSGAVLIPSCPIFSARRRRESSRISI